MHRPTIPRNIRPLILIALLGLLAPAFAAHGQDGPPLPPDGQRVELIRGAGGPVTASLTMPDGNILLSEGARLVLIGGDGAIIAQENLGHGAILALAEDFPLYYALTENGLAVLGAAGEGAILQLVNFVPGGGQSMAARGGLIVVAARQAGLRVIGLNANGGLESAVDVPIPGEALDVALAADGRRAYVAAGESGVQIVDLGDPAAPHLFGALAGVEQAEAVEGVGSLLAVGSGPLVQIVDPATASPGVVGQFSPLRQGERITIEGDYAYVADGMDGLKILWLAAPDRPVQVYGEVGQPARDVAVEGEVAFVAGESGLRILDVGSRFRPLTIGQIDLPGDPQGIELGEGIAYVALGAAGIALVDVSNRASPELVARIPLAGETHAAALAGEMLYAASGDEGLVAIDVSNPRAGALVATLPLPGPALDIERRGVAVYVAAGESGLLAVDITYPHAPRLAGALPPEPGQSAHSVAIFGKRAYVADGEGFQVGDINQPGQMGRLAYVRTPTNHVGASGVTVYALGGDRVGIYDARATAEPIFLRDYLTMIQIGGLDALGERLFLTNAGSGPEVVVLDVAAPDFPYESGNTGHLGHTYQARPAGGSVWLARGVNGLQEYEVSEGGALIPRGGYSSFSDVAHLALGGDRLLTGGRAGWALSAVGADGTRLTPVESGETPPVNGLDLNGDRAAIAAGSSGIAVFQIGTDGALAGFARAETPGPAQDIALDGATVYAAGSDGLTFYDPLYLQPLAQVDTPAPATGAAARDGVVYLALADGQLAVVERGEVASGVQIRSSLEMARPADLIPWPERGAIYALADNTLARLNASDPDRLRIAERGTLPEVAGRGFFVGGLLAAYLPGAPPLNLYDLARLEEGAIPRGSLPISGEALAVDGALLYVALGEGGMSFIDLTAPGPGTVFYEEPTHALLLEGDTLFALGEMLSAWDVSRPGAPALLSTLPLLAPGERIDAGPGDRLLVSLANGLSLAEWDGTTLHHLGHLTTVSAAEGAVQAGNRAFVDQARGGLLVVDVSDPASPTGLFSIVSPSGQFVHDLLPLDDSTFLASWEGGIDVIGVADEPSAAGLPHLVDTVETGGGEALDLALSEDGEPQAAVALGEDGVALLDLGDPLHPAVLARADTPGDGLDVALTGKALYVADGVCGLRVFDASDPGVLAEVGYWEGTFTSGVAARSEAEGDLLFAADASQLLTLRYRPDAPAISPPVPQSPMPSNGQGDTPLELTLAWSPPADPCHPLTYDLYLGTAQNPPFFAQVTGEAALEVADLRPRRTYYWYVQVTDQQGDVVRGPTWQFTTASATFADNLPPAPPPFIEQARRSPLIPIILAILLAGGLIVGLRLRRARRLRRTDEPPAWYGDGEAR